MNEYCRKCGKKLSISKSGFCIHCLDRKGKNNPMYGTNKVGENNPNWKGGKPKCKKCKKILTQRNSKTGYCMSCWDKSGKNNPCYRHGKSKNNKCIDCGVSINCASIRCGKCNGKINSGKQSSGYRTGSRSDNKPKCLDCGKTISFYAKYCVKCKSKGSRNSNYKDGITPLIAKIRYTDKYREWRNSIYKRDKYICQNCKLKGRRLHAHHIVKMTKIIRDYKITTMEESFDVNILWDINNGITLCENCHTKIEKVR